MEKLHVFVQRFGLWNMGKVDGLVDDWLFLNHAGLDHSLTIVTEILIHKVSALLQVKCRKYRSTGTVL